MRKVFAFVAAALFSVATFASREVVPSDDDLAAYATKTYTMCIYNESACNDIVLIGTYVSWDATAELLKFQPVAGFEGWYVVSWDDATDPTDPEVIKNGGIQAKPVQLTGTGTFSWDYQLSDESELIRGTAEVNPGNPGEADIKNIQPGIVVVDVKSWKNNPCTAVYHVYNVTFISPDCNDEDYVVPAISGGFNNWAQQALTLNELKTAERQQANLPGAVFEISFKGAEGSEYKFRSAEEWGKDWTNELKEYNAEEDAWGAYNGGANLVLGAETDLVFDLGDPEKYLWNNCEKPEVYEEKEFDYAITVANAPTCGEAVLAIVGRFEACGWDVAKAVAVENGVVSLHAKNTDEFKFLDKSTGDWSNEVQGFAQTTFHKADLADGAEDGKIAIDLAEAQFAACADGIEDVVLTEKAHKVVVDGVLYIVRDNKMYNAQGTQVR